MSDTLKERKIYRILTNSASKAWDKIAFWTTAKSVDAADGNNLETKVGAIKGITTSTNTTTTGYAADATVIKNLNDSLGGYKFTTKDGKIAYYKASAGADSATPFNGGIDGDWNFHLVVALSPGNSTVFNLKTTLYLQKGIFEAEMHTRSTSDIVNQTTTKSLSEFSPYFDKSIKFKIVEFFPVHNSSTFTGGNAYVSVYLVNNTVETLLYTKTTSTVSLTVNEVISFTEYIN